MPGMIKNIFERWKRLAHRIGEFQSRFILSVFYFLFLALFAIPFKLFSDPLQLKKFHGWLPRNSEDGDHAASAGRQF